MDTATNQLLPAYDPDPLLRTIGHTPLVALHSEPRVWLKLEGMNLTGSVKVRPAYRMIRAAEVAGKLTKDKIILDATSGNTGIAYAFIAARRGYRVKLFLPASASAQRKILLTGYGAELVLTDPGEGSDGAFFAMEQELRAHPDRYFCPDQYGNPQNPQAHYETTGPEIFEQTGGAVTHFVAGLGTSGTMMGAGRRLRELKPGIRLVAMQPDESFHGLEGLKHMATANHVPALYDDQVPDEFVGGSTEAAVDTAKRMMREEGLYLGISAGAAVWAGLHIAGQVKSGTIVVICPDGGDRYSWD
jgi:cysteine synthase B